MYYEGLLLLRTPMLPANKVYVVDDKENFISDNQEVITENINLLTQDFIDLELEFVNPRQTVSDHDLRIILEKQYHANPQEISALIEKSKANYAYNFWQILRNNDIEFHGPDLEIYNAFAIVSFSENQYQLYRFALHTLDDAKDLSRLIFNEYDYVVRPESYGFQGFGGWPEEREITTKPSPNVGKGFSAEEMPRLNKMNEIVATIVDTIQGMDREEGIGWLSRLIGENMIESLNLPAPKISGLAIDENLKLVLTDLGNEEVKIDPLTRAFYYLFLIYRRGVSFRYLENYQKPMFEIYKMLSNRTDLNKLKESVRNVLQPSSELIPQKISRLRRQFLNHYPRTIVDQYYIPHYQGDNENDFRIMDLDPEKISITAQFDFIREMESEILTDEYTEELRRARRKEMYGDENVIMAGSPQFNEPDDEDLTDDEEWTEEEELEEEEDDGMSMEEWLKLHPEELEPQEYKPNEVHYADEGKRETDIYVLS